MRILAALLLFSLPVTLSAQEASSNLTGKVRVNVYRYRQMFGKAIRPSIYCDGTDVARIQDGRFVTLALPSGKHTFSSNDKQALVEMDLKPDQEYYLRIDLVPGFAKGHGRISLVQPEQGAAELKQMKPADADMIKDKSLLASNPASEKADKR